MKYTSTVLAVSDITRARAFYESMFGLELFQDYGINISFCGGLSLQQDFGWLVNLPEDKIFYKPNNIELCFEEEDFDSFLEKLRQHPDIETLGGVIEYSWGQRVVRFYDLDGHLIEVGEDMKMVVGRFLSGGMTMEEISKKMDVSLADLDKLVKS